MTAFVNFRPAVVVQRLKASKLVRNAAILATGTVAGQMIIWSATPILTRLYSPAEYGVFGVFMTLAVLLAVIGTLRFDQAIMLERADAGAARVLALCFAVSIVVAVIAVPAVLLAQWAYRSNVGPAAATDIWDFLVFIPLLALPTSLRAAVNMAQIRGKNFKIVALTDVFNAGFMSGTQLVAGLLGAGAAGLIAGPSVAAAVSAGLLITFLWWQGFFKNLAGVTLSEVLAKARQHYRFAVFSMPGALLEKFAKRLPIFVLAAFFGVAEVGFFWLTFRLFVQPMRLLARNTRKAYYQRAVELHHRGRSLAPLLKRTTIILVLLTTPPMLCFAFFGEELFSFIFGAEWRRAGEYAQWMWILPIFALMRIPSLELAPIFNRQGTVLMFQSANPVLRAMALLVGGLYGDDLLAIALFSIVSASANFMLVLYFWRLALVTPPIKPTSDVSHSHGASAGEEGV